MPSGRTLSTSCSRSHCDPKRVASASAFGSVSMRVTCFSSTAVVFSVPAVATLISSASGPVPQRKKDSREASSRSPTR